MRKSMIPIALLLAATSFLAVAQMDDAAGMAADPHLRVAEHPVLGTYLTDADGRTLYVVVDDMGSPVPCAGECADAWPPLLQDDMGAMSGDMGEDAMGEDDMSGDGMAGDAMDGDRGMMASIDPMLVGAVVREDGITQVTYNGHPLYRFVGDVEPGEVTCQAIEQFGGTWYVLDPGGNVVTTALE